MNHIKKWEYFFGLWNFNSLFSFILGKELQNSLRSPDRRSNYDKNSQFVLINWVEFSPPGPGWTENRNDIDYGLSYQKTPCALEESGRLVVNSYCEWLKFIYSKSMQMKLLKIHRLGDLRNLMQVFFFFFFFASINKF